MNVIHSLLKRWWQPIGLLLITLVLPTAVGRLGEKPLRRKY